MAPTLQGAKWIKVEQKQGEGPGPRCSHAIAMVKDKLYSFGGELTPNVSIDKHLYVFDFNTHTWSIAPATGDVPRISCFGLRMVAVGTKLYVFGGRDAKRNTEDFYSYDTVKNEWKLLTKLDEEGGPEARGFPSMASDETHVYVFGGVSKGDRQNPPGRFKTTWVYNIDDGKWVKLPEPEESFEKRGGAGLAVVDEKIWVFYGLAGTMMAGGKKNEKECNAVHYFDQASKKWIEVETTGAKPSARSVFSYAVVGKYIIIFGGEITPDPKAHLFPGMLSNECFALDTKTLVWEKLGGGDVKPLGWAAYTSATVNGKQGLLMHGGKLMTNERTDDLYFYAFN